MLEACSILRKVLAVPVLHTFRKDASRQLEGRAKEEDERNRSGRNDLLHASFEKAFAPSNTTACHVKRSPWHTSDAVYEVRTAGQSSLLEHTSQVRTERSTPRFRNVEKEKPWRVRCLKQREGHARMLGLQDGRAEV